MTRSGSTGTPLEPTREASALDDPWSGTYVRIVLIEAVAIALLFLLGRMFS